MSFVLLGILNSQAAGAGGSVFPIPDVEPDLWLDASDASTITESGGSVSQWDNKGTLENFSQATSADQPTTGVSTLNGLNVIDFAEDFFTGSTESQWKFLHDGTIYFTVGVYKYENLASTQSIFGTNRASGGNPGIAIFFSSTNYKRNLQAGGFVTPIEIEDTSSLYPSDTFFIDSAIYDPTNGTAADRVDYFKNNTQGSVNNTNTAAVTSSDPNYPLDIGAFGDGILPLTGSIAELIIVSGADATETNRQIVVDYLNDKWGIF